MVKISFKNSYYHKNVDFSWGENWKENIIKRVNGQTKNLKQKTKRLLYLPPWIINIFRSNKSLKFSFKLIISFSFLNRLQNSAKIQLYHFESTQKSAETIYFSVFLLSFIFVEKKIRKSMNKKFKADLAALFYFKEKNNNNNKAKDIWVKWKKISIAKKSPHHTIYEILKLQNSYDVETERIIPLLMIILTAKRHCAFNEYQDASVFTIDTCDIISIPNNQFQRLKFLKGRKLWVQQVFPFKYN